MAEKYVLYFDDTGSRDPDKSAYGSPVRADRMDCFGLGGILIKQEDIGVLIQKHKGFCEKWSINYPLHSSTIRGRRAEFGWLTRRENESRFLSELQDFLISLPFLGIACVIHRPGYVERYKRQYGTDLWGMARTAFCILVERAAKFADAADRNLEIYFEGSGKKEDSNIIRYMRGLKLEGHPFDLETSEGYRPLAVEDYQRIVLGEPRHLTKQNPLIQIADLVLYPIAKGGYDPSYYPYKVLKESSKLIDSFLPAGDIPVRGIKYSCFDE